MNILATSKIIKLGITWLRKYEICGNNRRFIKLHSVPNVVSGYKHIRTDRELVPIGGYSPLLLENILLLRIAVITERKIDFCKLDNIFILNIK